MLSSVGLLSGCVTPSGDFCDIAKPMYFETDLTVEWLAENDEALLRDIVAHNEIAGMCR